MSREQRDKKLFNDIAGKYFIKDIAASSALPRKMQLLSAVNQLVDEQKKFNTIVDIGCGIGAPAKYLIGRYHKYIGIDHSQKMIGSAMEFNRDNPDVEFYAQNIKETKLQDNIADLVISIGALHHMTELDQVLESIKKIAKPNANILIIEPQNANPLIQFMRWARGFLDKGYSKEQISFSENDICALLAHHGVTNIKTIFEGYFTPAFTQVIASSSRFAVFFSRGAIGFDKWLQSTLRGPLKKLSFNVIVSGMIVK